MDNTTKRAVELVVATNNQGKAREIADMLGGDGATCHDPAFRDTMSHDTIFSVLTLAEALGRAAHIEETGETFEENARIKARAARALLLTQAGDAYADAIVMADDSGLCVDCLNGAPGVRSARFGGEGATDAERTALLLAKMGAEAGGPRTARFCCVIALVFPDGSEATAEGVCEGEIAAAPAGSNGFGYDPVFYIPQMGCTMAELTAERKNAISHRGAAVRKMIEILCHSSLRA